MLYSPFNIFLERVRLLFKKRVQDGQLAYLGDSDLPGARVEIPDRVGYVYCRFPGGRDATGAAKYSTPFPVRSAGAAFLNYPGAPVYVAYGKNDELQIIEAHYAELDKAGIDTRILNPLHQQSKWVYLWQLTIGLSSAVANSVNDSFLVTIKKYRHYVNNRFQSLETGLQADKIDLTAYNPATDMHRYAAVWTDTYLNVVEVTTSTTQSMFTPLDATDIQELVAERPPDAIPHKAFYLANNAGTVVQQAASDVDLRQFLNTPQIHGFPNPVEYRERIHPDRQVLFAGSMVVTGSLEILGSLVGIDSGTEGGGSGGIGGMTDFTVAGDSGTPQTIEDGNTLSILGGTGLSSVASATDTVTVNLDNTAVTPGSYTYSSLTVDAQGRLTAASSGAAPGTMSSFDIDADSGSVANIGNGELVEILGDGNTTESSIAANVITVGLKAAARPKLCDFRLSQAGIPYINITNGTSLDFVPVASATLTLPVAGVWHYFDAGDVTEQVEFNHVQTGNVTSGSTVITSMSNTERLAVGMKIAGTGINAAATISSIDSATQITMSHTASATNTGVTLTFTFPAAVNYDVFLKRVGGVVIPKYRKWSTGTSRGYTLTILDGVPVNDTDTDMRLMGCLRADASGFQRTERLCYISNQYHPYPHRMQVIDTTDSWNYTSTSFRYARGQNTNRLEIMSVHDYLFGSFHLTAYCQSTSPMYCGIGLNNSGAPTYGVGGVAPAAFQTPGVFDLDLELAAGFATVDWLEKGNTGGVWYGDQGASGLQSGLKGWVMA